MIKIESATLQDAYEKAAMHFSCSVTELQVEVLQHPSSGFLGFFKKTAIIVASCKNDFAKPQPQLKAKKETSNTKPEKQKHAEEKKEIQQSKGKQKNFTKQNILNDTILPTSFVSGQDDEYYEEELSAQEYKNSYSNDMDKNYFSDSENERNIEEIYLIDEIVPVVKQEINNLFKDICFDIEAIEVKAYDPSTLLVEITGEDSALLIGKEGYRYKALSYMIFNWINSKYQLQLRLEIAEFLKNQEESVSRYLVGVCETVEREGRAQTKILDGVLVQIALKQLRSTYPDKYVAIRSTRDGLKFIIINDYNGY
ncbi:Jag N-terminal domain-containing protein [Sulfurimonas sp. HSL-1716]|uniref:Jag N-terminal domain-containing protein n=1 Tax=Hydrocurvibacter sulfurireducens TaxID=3131937 RepID=UPI0031F8D24F